MLATDLTRGRVAGRSWRLLARKITKRIHSSKPASPNRPIDVTPVSKMSIAVTDHNWTFPLTVFTCGDGYYSAATATTCLPCPGGYDCTNKAITPVECAQGSYSSNASLGCTTCPAGYSCPDAGMIEPVACPAGWYQTATGQQSCTECGQGV